MSKPTNQHPVMMITTDEQEGVMMIQGLQIFIGQSESEDVSLENWRRMSPGERQATRQAYYALFINKE